MRQQKMNPQSGFSLVSILVIMAVVLISILMISQTKIQQQSVQKALKMKQSYTDINQSLINDVVTEIHNQLKNAPPNTCAKTNTMVNRPLDAQITHSYFATALSGLNANAPSDHKNAYQRCLTPENPPHPRPNWFYFCTRLSRDPKAARDSIMNARMAFAEFSVELIDLQTQQPISCDDYRKKVNDIVPGSSPPVQRDGSAGMIVTMVLYWENDLGAQSPNGDLKNNKSTFSQKALSYIANQNN